MTEIHEDQGNRQRILDVAVDLFANKGYDAVSVREIAEAAKVTKPVIYYYFENKRDLYMNLIREAFQESNRMYKSIYEDDSPSDEKLRQLMRAHFRYCLDYPNRIKVLFDTMEGHSNVTDINLLREDARVNFNILADIIRLGQSNGIFSKDVDPDKITLMFFGTMNTFIMHHFIEKQSYLSDTVADEIIDMLINGISLKNHSKPAKE